MFQRLYDSYGSSIGTQTEEKGDILYHEGNSRQLFLHTL